MPQHVQGSGTIKSYRNSAAETASQERSFCNSKEGNKGFTKGRNPKFIVHKLEPLKYDNTGEDGAIILGESDQARGFTTS